MTEMAVEEGRTLVSISPHYASQHLYPIPYLQQLSGATASFQGLPDHAFSGSWLPDHVQGLPDHCHFSWCAACVTQETRGFIYNRGIIKTTTTTTTQKWHV